MSLWSPPQKMDEKYFRALIRSVWFILNMPIWNLLLAMQDADAELGRSVQTYILSVTCYMCLAHKFFAIRKTHDNAVTVKELSVTVGGYVPRHVTVMLEPVCNYIPRQRELQSVESRLWRP